MYIFRINLRNFGKERKMKWSTRAKCCKAILSPNNYLSGPQRLRALAQKSLRKVVLEDDVGVSATSSRTTHTQLMKRHAVIMVWTHSGSVSTGNTGSIMCKTDKSPSMCKM